MSWSSLLLQGGASGIQNVTSFILQSREAASNRRWQKWRNEVVNISNAMNQNTITVNEIKAKEASAIEAHAIRASKRLVGAQVEQAAAVAGVTGRSVQQTINQVNRDAARADERRVTDLENRLMGYATQRDSSQLQALQQTEFSPIPNPTGASQLLNFGTDIADLWKQYGTGIKNKT